MMEITNAQYGRSAKGIKILVAKMQKQLSFFNGSYMEVVYSKIRTAVQQNWSGADADRFLKKLEEFWKEYDAQVKKMSKNLETIMADELKNFKASQGKISF